MINYIKENYKIQIFCLLLISFIIPCNLYSLPKNLLNACTTGDVNTLSEKCGEFIVTQDAPSELAKAYSILAFSYILQGTADSEEQCAGILDLLPDDEEFKLVKLLINVLSGEGTPNDFSDITTDIEWQSAFALTAYLYSLKNNADGDVLFKYYNKYITNAKKLPRNSWIGVWKQRIIKWQLWLQNGKGAKLELEPFIASFPALSRKVSAKILALSKEKKDNCNLSNSITNQNISSILKLYLNNEIEKGKANAEKYKKTSTPQDKLYILADYLSGDSKITEKNITTVCQEHAEVWTLATIVLFVKNLADSDTLNKYKLYYYLDNFDGNYKLLNNKKDFSDWNAASTRWRQWIDNGFSINGIISPEKLIIEKSKISSTTVKKEVPSIQSLNLNLDEIDIETYTTERNAKYANRPRPDSIEFDKDIFNKYLDTLDAGLASKEKKRLELVKEVKHYIIIVLEHTPYPNGLIIKRKGKKKKKTRKIKGVVYLANKHHIRIKKSARSKKGKNYNWDDLAFEQYIKFIEFFAERRLKMTDASFVKKEEFAEDAAKDYYALAFMCDWYGNYELSIKYAKKCIEIKPEFSVKIKNLLID